MERDNLKKYIQQHREAFDDLPAPPEMFRKVMTRMRKRKLTRRRRMYSIAAAACIGGLLLLSYPFLFHPEEPEEINPVVVVQEHPPVPVAELHSDPTLPKIVEVPAPEVRAKIAVQRGREHYRKIYAGLHDSHSVARRIDAVLTISEIPSPDRRLTAALLNTFSNDESSNVRLEALNVLLKYAGDSLIQQRLVHALGVQKDPAIQIELVSAMENNTDPRITEKLIEIADDPFTIPPVREQVYFALSNR